MKPYYEHAVACKQHGTAFIGCEIKESFLEVAAKRLSQEVFDFKALEAHAK